MRRAATLLFVGGILCAAAPVRADNVLSGVDIYEVLPTSRQSFTGPYEIPANFFGPGSEPFTGTVSMASPPLVGIPSCSLLPALPYTATRRTADAFFPGGETVPIEILQLSLVSANPIIVNYPGGVTEQWNIQMSISPGPPGTMTLEHGVPGGGTFSAQFFVQPHFVFVREDGPAPIQFFTPDVGAGDVWVFTPAPWSHTPAAGGLELPGCTTNFFPGVSPEPAALVAVALPPFSPLMIVGPFTSLDCRWPAAAPTPTRRSSWGRIKARYR